MPLERVFREAHAEALRLYPTPSKPLPPEEIYADLFLPKGHPDGLPYVAINMVATIDGRAAVDGKASPLGSDLDRLLMRNIRCAFDAVLVGAGTLRGEEISLGVPEEMAKRRIEKGLTDQPLGVVLAGSERLPTERRIFGANCGGQEAAQLAIICSGVTPEKGLREASSRGAEVVRLPGDERRPRAREVAEVLRKRFGVTRLLVEGGPSVNHSFLSDSLVDELFMTLAPKLVGGEATGAPNILEGSRIPAQSSSSLRTRILSAYLSEDELFLRYATRP